MAFVAVGVKLLSFYFLEEIEESKAVVDNTSLGCEIRSKLKTSVGQKHGFP